MIRNYFKIAVRNLFRNKIFSTINIAGLTTGLTCCLLMVLYLQHELSYDSFNEKGDRTVRVIMEYGFNGSTPNKGNYTSTKVLPSFKRNFPEVEDGVRIDPTARLVKYGDKLFNEKNFVYADSTFFDIFSFKLLKGNASQVLKAPKMVVLSATAAKKYFGNEDPVGKSLLIGSMQDAYLVTGVAEDCPSNSQIKFDFLASFSSYGTAQEETYFNANYTTYLLLKQPSSIASMQGKILPFMQRELSEQPGVYINYELEPLKKIHLYSSYDAIVPNSNIMYVYIIAGVALLVLIIACFTYINLSTARSVERAREVGVRKVSGAYRMQIFWQFICESLIIVTVSMLISICFAYFLLPAFNQLADTQLLFKNIAQPNVILASLILVLAIALLAGSYPALILSKFQPVKVLKGSYKSTSAGAWLRKSLIIFQFTVSVFLIVSTIIIKGQLQYIQSKKLGYEREHVLVMGIDQKIYEKAELVKTELKTNPDILSVSLAYETPVHIKGGYSMNSIGHPKEMIVNANPVDEDYLKTNGLEIVAGSDLNKQDVADASKEDYTKCYYHFVLNETAAKELGWAPQEAIGKKMFLGEDRPGEVKAVIKDFHYESLHNPIGGLVLFPGGWWNTLLVKTNGKNTDQAISFIGKKWKELAPHRPLEYRFMDEDYQRMYEAEMRTGKVFNIFSGIAILLACIGLFGLSAYAARQRIKEIGVRKILGASIANIALLLSASFLQLVFISFLIACPLAWLAMSQWLQDFEYRISIEWWVFAVAGMAALSIALLTVSVEAIKAALSNPVKSLRTE